MTAGPTREMLDPVRFLSNRSTGEMGYAIARAAQKRGYQVTLISGPVALKPPKGISVVPVTSARDLQKACQRYFPRHDILVMSAAVCDFTAAHFYDHKIRRTRTHQLHLKRTPDIISGLAKRKKASQVVIGFSLETEAWLANAQQKIRRKRLDGIVANYYQPNHIPFGKRKLTVAFLDARGGQRSLRQKSKGVIARKLLHWMEEIASKNR
ncbi:MAG: phosphopantothenoylcysteine decarboxylase [Candidatus Omnitrophica bacterium]|nr:phosphopantothenoylcysteine decarboxylase [Candidatus Omnitrophota bacterium]